MIISNTAELRKYVSVNASFIFEDFAPYIDKAINSYTEKYVGKLHVILKDAESSDDSIKNQAREYLRAAIANFGFFLYQPFLQLQIDGSGFSVAISENRKQPEWYQLADVRRELLRSGHEAMDRLMEVLEKNPTEFPDWTNNYATTYKDLIVKNAEEFSACYNIYNSRQTFLALVPIIRQVEIQILKNFITKAFILELKGSVSDADKLEVKKYIQQAVVATVVSRIYNEGIFHFDSTGVKLKFDILPNEKVQAIDYGKPAEQLQRAIKIQLDNATQFILLAKEIIEEKFSDNLITTASPKSTVIGTGGLIGL